MEGNPEIVNAARVLAKLEAYGLKEPGIASGFVRSWIANTAKSDIDVAYVGDVPYHDAQQYLSAVLRELRLDKTRWDIKGIWNIQHQYPQITRTELNFKYLYVCSIDSVYLASDGRLHDTMGTGIEDARKRVLRMNDFRSFDFPYPDDEIVYLCIEGCRRIAKFGWTPTKRSVDLIASGREFWDRLPRKQQSDLLRKRIIAKYRPGQYAAAQQLYDRYGWGFLFSELSSRFPSLGQIII
jgi:hypothetical protein